MPKLRRIRTRRFRPSRHSPRALVDIPVFDAPSGPLDIALAHRELVLAVLAQAQDRLSPALLRLGDRISAHWLERVANPYLPEIDAIAALLGRSGSYALNMSLEWGCTSGCTPRTETATTLCRTLDWPLPLGAEVVVARHQAPAGAYYNVTWPGFVGVLTGMAPGRFSAAINQAPMRYSLPDAGLTMPVDWLVNRVRVSKSRGLPPAHLLRMAFETCATYEEARRLLSETPLCVGAFFTLGGSRPGEACVIERQEHAAVIHDAEAEGLVCVANHWLNPYFRGRARRTRKGSAKRLRTMQEHLHQSTENFDWLAEPVLNLHTQLAVEMNAGTGDLRAIGLNGSITRTSMLAVHHAMA